MFDEKSGLVQIWVRQVKENPKLRAKVPKLDNLQEVFFDVLDRKEDA